MKYANTELADTWALLQQFYRSYGRLVSLKLRPSRRKTLLESKSDEWNSLLTRALNQLFENDHAKSAEVIKPNFTVAKDALNELVAAASSPASLPHHAAFMPTKTLLNLQRRTTSHSDSLLLAQRMQSALNACGLFDGGNKIHARGFKTRSSSRIQSTSTKERAAEDEQNSLFRRMSNMVLRPERQATEQQQQNAAIVNEEAVEKYLKGDPKLSENEQNRVKVAFLEGLVSGKFGSTSAAATGGKESKTPLATEGGGLSSKNVLAGLKSFMLFLITLGFILVMLTLLSNVASMRQLMGMSQHEIVAESVDVSFDDVRGCDEAKDELREIVEYLKHPERFSSLGGRLPKGVLLIGPPGTGKTLLGRAVAGEAGVPFFHVAGSEFDEILVGQGARRVRDLFTSAKEKAPCVIFIDEIDAVGSKRTSSVIHPHANQTINQLLAEMDGFHQNEGVIVLGATNRRDDLDKALTRPGRFDIEVHVPTPDLKGRTDIITYYLAKIRTAADVDAEALARGTTGFTGADLEAMINQSALKGASDGCTEVSMEYLEHSRDKVLMGPAKKFRIPDEEANRLTAFHEAGHTLVAYFTEHSMPLHKVTIIPRGMSLGHTAYIPEKETYQTTRAQLIAMVDTLLGGRAAEELIFGDKFITSGASDDLRKASDIVRQMVKQFGMSERVGLRSFRNDSDSENGLFAQPDGSPQTQDIIDQEIRRILQESYERAKAILTKNAKEHTALAEALLSHETLDAKQIKMIVEGRGANMPKLKRLL